MTDIIADQIAEARRREAFITDDELTTFTDRDGETFEGTPDFVEFRGAQVEVTDPEPGLTPEQEKILEGQGIISFAEAARRLETRIDTETFEDVAEELFDECFDLLVERQKKYGPNNIAQQGLFGVLTRIRDDKISRIQRALNGRVVKGEIVLDDIDLSGEEGDTLEDAYKDVANYAVISLLLLRGKWGKPLAEDVGA